MEGVHGKPTLRYYPVHYEEVWDRLPCRYFIKLGKRHLQYKEDGTLAEVYVWKFDLKGLLFDSLMGLFRRASWFYGICPSYSSALSAIVTNVRRFVKFELVPWYLSLWELSGTLYENNDSKLLATTCSGFTMRSRQADCRYFKFEAGLLYGSLKMIRYLSRDDPERPGMNVFLSAFSSEDLIPVETTLVYGPILTRRQCQAFLERAVKETSPYLSWHFPPDDDAMERQ